MSGIQRHKKGVRGSLPRAEAPVSVQVRVGLSPLQAKILDERRGKTSRADYLRDHAELYEPDATDCPDCGDGLEWGESTGTPGATSYASCERCGYHCILERQKDGEMKRRIATPKMLKEKVS